MVTVLFNKNKIIIQDDTKGYDLKLLSGKNGGAEAWDEFGSIYIYNSLVNYRYKKTNHYFTLVKSNSALRKIVENCKAEILKNTIGSGFNRNILSYDDRCKEIYVDDRLIRMKSRRNSLISEVEELLKIGKLVYVSVTDKNDGQVYRSKLSNHVDKLRIIVDK